jgi:hypothetical protein
MQQEVRNLFPTVANTGEEDRSAVACCVLDAACMWWCDFAMCSTDVQAAVITQLMWLLVCVKLVPVHAVCLMLATLLQQQRNCATVSCYDV